MWVSVALGRRQLLELSSFAASGCRSVLPGGVVPLSPAQPGWAGGACSSEGLAGAKRSEDTQVAPRALQLSCGSEPGMRLWGLSKGPPSGRERTEADCSVSTTGLRIRVSIWGLT